MGGGLGEVGENAARTLTIMRDSVSFRDPGRKYPEEGGYPGYRLSSDILLIRARETMAPASEAPAQRRATKLAVRAGGARGGRRVRIVAVDPIIIAA